MDSVWEGLAVLGEGRPGSVSQSWARLGPWERARSLGDGLPRPQVAGCETRRPPVVRDHCEISVALEVVKPILFVFYFILDQH